MDIDPTWASRSCQSNNHPGRCASCKVIDFWEQCRQRTWNDHHIRAASGAIKAGCNRKRCVADDNRSVDTHIYRPRPRWNRNQFREKQATVTRAQSNHQTTRRRRTTQVDMKQHLLPRYNNRWAENQLLKGYCKHRNIDAYGVSIRGCLDLVTTCRALRGNIDTECSF